MDTMPEWRVSFVQRARALRIVSATVVTYDICSERMLAAQSCISMIYFDARGGVYRSMFAYWK